MPRRPCPAILQRVIRCLPGGALLALLCSPAAAAGAGSYAFPADKAGFPFPVRRVYDRPARLYRLYLEPELGIERRRIGRELRAMAGEPSRILLKTGLTALLETLSLSCPRSRGWLFTHTPGTLSWELGGDAAMSVLNRETIPRIAGTVVFESHQHTLVSHDSAAGIETLLLHAAARGVQALAVTDHNSIEGARRAEAMARALREDGRLPRDFIVVTGEEIAAREGHVIGLFLTRRIPPRLTARDTIEEIHRQGGVAVAPHPGWKESYLRPALARRLPFDAVEIANGGAFLPFDFFTMLNGERSRTTLIGTDAHISQATGWLGYNRVTAVPTATALRDALLAGRSRPVFTGPYAPYRRIVNSTPAKKLYRVGSLYFSLLDRTDDFFSSALRIDRFHFWTAYDPALRDLLNLVEAPRVIDDFSRKEGVFGRDPEFGVDMTMGRIVLSYRRIALDNPTDIVRLRYRLFF